MRVSPHEWIDKRFQRDLVSSVVGGYKVLPRDQAAGHHENVNVLVPSSQTSGLQNCEKWTSVVEAHPHSPTCPLSIDSIL